MDITVNGELKQVPEDISLRELVVQMGLEGRRIAVELNLDIVPRSEHSQTMLKTGDRVEIVHAIGGG
ncbi:MAG: sulfur carrier protein ThiS [Hahellaceae bacterium]|nr:sulfur carrier protein ThiS [Hahellaceae bacterium]MCP5170437.1 sulfur carrier protein ThiS [Hahellaceae bacterium]